MIAPLINLSLLRYAGEATQVSVREQEINHKSPAVRIQFYTASLLLLLLLPTGT